MKNPKELTQEIGRIRARAKELSGFWISELASAIYTLEWAAGKRDAPPSADIGSAGGEHGKIADRLLHAVSSGAASLPAKKEPEKAASAPSRRNPARPASKQAGRRSESKQLATSRGSSRPTRKS